MSLLYLLWILLDCVICSFLKYHMLYFIPKGVVYHSLASRCESAFYYWLRPPWLRPVHRHSRPRDIGLTCASYLLYYYYYETHLSALFNFKMNLYINDLINTENLALLF